MTNEELLVAMTRVMSDMLDEKLDKKLDEKLDQKLDEKLNPIKADISGLKQDVSGLKRDVSGLKQDVSNLKSDMAEQKAETQSLKSEMQGLKTETQGLKERRTNVEILLENYVVPNLKDLCKVVNTEYRKYEISIESHEQMKTDTDVLKSVVSDHSERIIRLEKMNGLSSAG